MKKKSGTILAVVLGVLAFIGALAVVAYVFRDKLRALCPCRDEDCDCDDCCDPDYFEICDDDDLSDSAEDAADAVKDAAEDLKDAVQDKVQDVVDDVKEKTDEE